MKLTDIQCKSAKPKEKKYKLIDGRGLFLLVMPNGSKYWQYRYLFMGKEKLHSIGVYPEVGLSEARELHREAHKLVSQGINPIEEKKAAKQQLKTDHNNTFEAIAREWVEHKKSEASEKYCNTILTRLEKELFKPIGSLPIKSITPKIMLDALKSIEERGALEMTRRVRQYAKQIFDYAIAHDLVETNPTAPITRAFKTKKVEHQKALPLEELPNLLQKIEQNDARLYPQTRLALKLMLLTFTRKKELTDAKWKEINLKDKVWIIPAKRMKMKKEHIVPLSDQSVAIFKELQEISSQWEYVFPSFTSPRKPMHEDTILRALYRFGYKGQATIHGFRALAMSTIMEKLGYRFEVPDRQLAHSRGNNVKAAYERAEFLDDRKRMMQDWADYLDKIRGKTNG